MDDSADKAKYSIKASEKIIDTLDENGIDPSTGITVLSAALCKYIIRHKRNPKLTLNTLPKLMEQYKELEKLP